MGSHEPTVSISKTSMILVPFWGEEVGLLKGFKRFLQFVPVTGSRELEGKAAKLGVGFGDDQ